MELDVWKKGLRTPNERFRFSPCDIYMPRLLYKHPFHRFSVVLIQAAYGGFLQRMGKWKETRREITEAAASGAPVLSGWQAVKERG
jgi:hypothetical protein